METKRVGKIYKITNLLSGKLYIGQTINSVRKRFLQHSNGNTPIGYAMRKYGIENFKYEIIETCDIDKLNEREIFWIAFFNCKVPNGYNRTDGGRGLLGCSHPCKEETKRKLSIANKGQVPWIKGKKLSAETRARISKGLMGNKNGAKRKNRKHTAETKLKISEALIGNKNSLGREVTAETRAKISKSLKGNKNASGNKGRKLSEETKAKISAALRGRPGHKIDEETRAKISKSRKGIKHTAESRAKISAAVRNPSPETRAKLSAATKAYWARKRAQAAENTNGTPDTDNLS